jgi:LuxR family maltose regulon positive regulatory protein
MLAHVSSSGGTADPGYFKAVEQWAAARSLSAEVPINLMDDEFEILTWVRLLIIQDEPDQVLPLLARLLKAAGDGGRTGRVIEILNLQALAQQALGDMDEALNALERALSLAEPEGYIRLFVDEGRPMAKLLQQVARQGIALDYVTILLDAFSSGEPFDYAQDRQRSGGAGGKESASTPQLPSSPAPIEALSERETDVLRLLNTDLSSPEIAAELVVSVNTVRTHIKHIYDKLNAHSRYEAVERAKELGLL